MRALAALLLAALAACAAPPAREPPLAYPPSARERMLRIALAEWEEWGRIVVVPGGPRLAGAAPESAIANFPRVLAYWNAVPEEEGAVARNRARYRAGLAAVAPCVPGAVCATPASLAIERLWAEPPWSAAFISHVMRAAGIGAREFPPTAAHSTYIDALIADALAFPAAAPFIPRRPAEYAPRVGDLLCADRSARPLADWAERAADRGRFRPMHCDIVVGTASGLAAAIGGNVRDAVTLTRFPTDPGGLILPPPPGAPSWFAVFENRLGLLPPWGPALAPATPVARTASRSAPS